MGNVWTRSARAKPHRFSAASVIAAVASAAFPIVFLPGVLEKELPVLKNAERRQTPEMTEKVRRKACVWLQLQTPSEQSARWLAPFCPLPAEVHSTKQRPAHFAFSRQAGVESVAFTTTR